MIVEYEGYNIDSGGPYGMRVIKTIGRGSLPIELRGEFTSVGTACKAIDISRSKRENTNAEVSSTSRG